MCNKSRILLRQRNLKFLCIYLLLTLLIVQQTCSCALTGPNSALFAEANFSVKRSLFPQITYVTWCLSVVSGVGLLHLILTYICVGSCSVGLENVEIFCSVFLAPGNFYHKYNFKTWPTCIAFVPVVKAVSHLLLVTHDLQFMVQGSTSLYIRHLRIAFRTVRGWVYIWLCLLWSGGILSSRHRDNVHDHGPTKRPLFPRTDKIRKKTVLIYSWLKVEHKVHFRVHGNIKVIKTYGRQNLRKKLFTEVLRRQCNFKMLRNSSSWNTNT